MEIRNLLSLFLNGIALLGLAFGCPVPGFSDWEPARSRGDMNRMLEELTISTNAVWTPGELVYQRIELGLETRRMLQQSGSVEPRYAILSVRYPMGGAEPNPKVFFTSVTSDIYAPNAYSIRKYIDAVNGGNWILMSVDADVWPERDNVIWRLILFGEAMRYLQENWADYSRARFSYGGYSGGSKIAVYLAFFSMKIGKPPMGIFMGGCNEPVGDSASEIAGIPLENLRQTPLAFSIGAKDRIAKPRESRRVVKHWEKQGFSNILSLEHPDGHVLYPKHVRESLKWFEQEISASNP